MSNRKPRFPPDGGDPIDGFLFCNTQFRNDAIVAALGTREDSMWHKNQQVRYIFWIVAVQTACAGTAFFIYYQMVLSAVSQSTHEDVTRELSTSLLLDAVCTILWLGVLLGVIMYLFVTKVFEHFAKTQHKSETEALRQVQSLVHAQDAIIIGLAKLAESRDDDTGHHLERMSVYACRLAAAASCHPKYRDQITGEFINLLRVSASLHDIGKVGIQDRILLKPGRLTAAERSEMQRHPDDRRRLPAGDRAAVGELQFPANGAGDRAVAPRALGRDRLSGRIGRRGNSACRANCRDCRRVRCAFERSRLPERLSPRAMRRDDSTRGRKAVRPGSRGDLLDDPGGLPRDRALVRQRLGKNRRAVSSAAMTSARSRSATPSAAPVLNP